MFAKKFPKKWNSNVAAWTTPASTAGGGGSTFLLGSITTQPSGAFSTRLMSSSYAGNSMLIGVNAGASVTSTNIGFTSSGVINQADIDTFFVANSDAFGYMMYNQSSASTLNIGSSYLIANSRMSMRQGAYNGGAQQTVNGKSAANFTIDITAAALKSTYIANQFINSSAFTVIIGGRYVNWVSSLANPEAGGAFSDNLLGYISAGSFVSNGTVQLNTNIFDGADKTASATITSSANYIAVCQFNGATITEWVNGGAPAATQSSSYPDDLTYQQVTLNPTSNSGTFFLLDLLWYNTALSVADLNTLAAGSGITGGGGSLSAFSGVSWTTLSSA